MGVTLFPLHAENVPLPQILPTRLLVYAWYPPFWQFTDYSTNVKTSYSTQLKYVS